MCKPSQLRTREICACEYLHRGISRNIDGPRCVALHSPHCSHSSCADTNSTYHTTYQATHAVCVTTCKTMGCMRTSGTASHAAYTDEWHCCIRAYNQSKSSRILTHADMRKATSLRRTLGARCTYVHVSPTVATSRGVRHRLCAALVNNTSATPRFFGHCASPRPNTRHGRPPTLGVSTDRR